MSSKTAAASPNSPASDVHLNGHAAIVIRLLANQELHLSAAHIAMQTHELTLTHRTFQCNATQTRVKHEDESSIDDEASLDDFRLAIDALLHHMPCAQVHLTIKCSTPQAETPPHIDELLKILARMPELQVVRHEFIYYPLDTKCKVLQKLILPRDMSQLQHTCMDEKARPALQAVYSLLHQLEWYEPASQALSVQGACQVKSLAFSFYMPDDICYIDDSAIQALQLLPRFTSAGQPVLTSGALSQTLFGLLNQCRTTVGPPLLRQRIAEPLMSPSAIDRRLDLVEALFSSDKLRDYIRQEALNRAPHLDKTIVAMAKYKSLYSMTKATDSSSSSSSTATGLPRMNCDASSHPLSLMKLWHLNDFISTHCDGMHRELQSYRGKHASVVIQDLVKPLTSIINTMDRFCQLCVHTIDASKASQHTFTLRKNLTAQLGELAQAEEALESEFNALRIKAAKRLGLQDESVKIDKSGKGAHLECFRVTTKDGGALRQSSEYQITETIKSGIMFSNPKIAEVAQRLAQVRTTREKANEVQAHKVRQIACTFMPIICQLASLIALIDVTSTLAHCSRHAPIPYVRPVVQDKSCGTIKLSGARHPCLEAQIGVQVIANDVELEKGNNNIQIVTGPNAGGKSTYIRLIGVVCILAQMGCFVPCESACISVVDRVLARVSANDANMAGMSTFQLEMSQSQTILQNATQYSLMIIDELGRGTSTYDGFGLAWAMKLTNLAKDKSEKAREALVKQQKALNSDLANMHAEVSQLGDRITMTYRILEGGEQRSFGIRVAQQQEFPANVVAHAQQQADRLEAQGRQVRFDLHLQEEMQQQQTTVKSEKPDTDQDLQFAQAGVANLDYSRLDDKVLEEFEAHTKNDSSSPAECVKAIRSLQKSLQQK